MPKKEYYCHRCKIRWSGTWICPSCREWGVVYKPIEHGKRVTVGEVLRRMKPIDCEKVHEFVLDLLEMQ